MIDTLIYGGGMLGRQVAHLVTRHFASQYRIVGFIDDTRPATEEVYEGIFTVGSLAQALDNVGLGPHKCLLLFGIGYSDMLGRGRAFRAAKAAGYKFASLIHPFAHVESSARLGEGVIALAGAIVDQYVTIGDVSYLHIGSRIGENCHVGINNYFSAGSTLGGSVQMGDDNFLGINATIVNDINIGNHNFVNAAALVYRNLADHMRLVEYREQRDVAILTNAVDCASKV